MCPDDTNDPPSGLGSRSTPGDLDASTTNVAPPSTEEPKTTWPSSLRPSPGGGLLSSMPGPTTGPGSPTVASTPRPTDRSFYGIRPHRPWTQAEHDRALLYAHTTLSPSATALITSFSDLVDENRKAIDACDGLNQALTALSKSGALNRKEHGRLKYRLRYLRRGRQRTLARPTRR